MKEYIVLSRQNNTTKTGSPFATLKVANLEETLNVAVWDLPANAEPVVGRIVSFYVIRDNQGKKACNRTDLKVMDFPTENHPLYNLLPRPIKREVWDATLQHLISYCTDERLIGIIREFGEKLYKPYSEYPAATVMHHAYPGGLLNHTHQMLDLLDGMYPHLPYAVKPERCVLSIMFHDYGKVYEYNRQGETQPDMYLLGHIYIGAHKLQLELEKQGIEAEETKRIVHCVLAHHGTHEFGSPVVPATQEAILVNMIDNLSAKTDAANGTGDMEKNFALETHVVK
ncbi:MAG: HD domain-containing protein [Bacteroidaceae bacterium]|nr:HD domain-containing protein [Bacteroidaceae bacterium]